MQLTADTTDMSWQEMAEYGTLMLEMAREKGRVAQRLTRWMEENAPEGKERLTQEEAAARAGVHLRQWQRWQGGDTVPHLKNLEALSDALGIPLDDFRDATPEPNGTGTQPRGDDILTRLERIETTQQEIAQSLAELAQSLAELAQAVQRQLLQAEPAPPPQTSRSARTAARRTA